MNISLNWFKKQQELINTMIEDTINKEQQPQQQSEIPYKSIKMVNDVLTVVLNDGSILTKNGATSDDFSNLRNAKTEDTVIKLMSTREIYEERQAIERAAERAKVMQEGLVLLKGLKDFEVEENSVKLAGTGRTLPQMLVEEFVEIVGRNKYYAGFGNLQDRLDSDKQYVALKRFFMWCCLNPRAEVADDLYGFLKENSFRITEQGFFTALRNVVTLHGGTEFVQFVSESYNKVKAVWKKNPDSYEVYLKNGHYSLYHIDDTYTTEVEDCECIEDGYREECDECYNGEVEYTIKRTDIGEHLGNLTELYLDLPNRHENRFTDAHTRTFDIRIGRVVNMPPEACNWSTADCAHAGLHFTADQIHYVGCGDQSVLVLINPMKVVGIGAHKGRCYEYLPIMTVHRDEATDILHDLNFDTLQLDDAYAIRELQDLQNKVKEGFVAEVKKYEFNIPQMTMLNIVNIIDSLEEMKKTISSRVVINE